MKRLSAALLWLSLVPFAEAVTPFELPWMNSMEGQPYKSADYPDAVFVVEAYFLGCHYCNENAPNVNELKEMYIEDARVQILDVGVDRHDSDYDTWITKHGPNHPVLKDSSRKLISQLGTTGYPSTYVLNSKGEVLYTSTGVWGDEKKQSLIEAVNTALGAE